MCAQIVTANVEAMMRLDIDAADGGPASGVAEDVKDRRRAVGRPWVRKVSRVPGNRGSVPSARMFVELALRVQTGERAWCILDAADAGEVTLDGEEVRVLAREAKDGAQALAAIVEGTRGLVKSCALKVSQRHGWEDLYVGDEDMVDELVQYGYFGLMNAAQNFDAACKTKFTTYAYTCITNEMKQGIAHLRKISLSNKDFLKRKIIDETARKLERELHQKPSSEAVARAVQESNEIDNKLKGRVDANLVEVLLNAGAGCRSVDEVAFEDGDATILDYLDDANAPSTSSAAWDRAADEFYDHLFGSLEPAQYEALRLCFGLKDRYSYGPDVTASVRELDELSLRRLVSAAILEIKHLQLTPYEEGFLIELGIDRAASGTSA